MLGIDPGLRATGYGLLAVRGRELAFLASGEICPQGQDLAVRLARIYSALAELIERHRPDAAAIEEVFVHRNMKTALKLGQARGAAVAACACAGLPVSEYTASEVKLSTVGSGRADKRQVQYMVRMLLRLRAPVGSDAADALAVAICHAHLGRSRLLGGRAGARAR